MKCPYKENMDCPFVDTGTMDKLTHCLECEYYWVDGSDFIDDINGFMMLL